MTSTPPEPVKPPNMADERRKRQIIYSLVGRNRVCPVKAAHFADKRIREEEESVTNDGNS